MGKFGAAVCLILGTGAAWAGCDPGAVEFRNSAGVTAMRFSVEVADDDAERALGLMNRDSLPMSSGMLFVYPQPRRAMFWMKNTRIPLDMIFLDATGVVRHVHANAQPMDETSIDGGEGVTYVLEINGGLASVLGLEPGAVMRSEVLDQSEAVWACDQD